MEHLRISTESLQQAKDIINSGGVIIFPTETVYGIGTSVNSEGGVKRIYDLKIRPNEKQLQVLISNIEQLNGLVDSIPNNAKPLIEKYWPGPLTIVFKKKGSGTVGIRMPNHQVPLEIIRDCGPIFATSANISGKNPPISADDVDIDADLLLDDGPCLIKEASTVVDATGENLKILRQGSIKI